jgi:hypothetical protein
MKVGPLHTLESALRQLFRKPDPPKPEGENPGVETADTEKKDWILFKQ